MYVLTIAYPKSADASFDFDYYRATHLPKIGEAFRPFGLGYAAVLRGEQSVDGGEPAFFVTTLLSFATEEGARNAVASEAGQALVADAANVTSATPLMQWNTSVE